MPPRSFPSLLDIWCPGKLFASAPPAGLECPAQMGRTVLDPAILPLLSKLLTAAAVVIVVATLVERSGPFLGAMIVTLPISTGPAYVFLAMDHPPAFLATSALSSLVANAATPVFMTLYAAMAQTRSVATSLGIALLAWGGVAGATSLVTWSLASALALNVVLYALGGMLLRRFSYARRNSKPAARWWDLPIRALAAMALCGAVLVSAQALGPRAAGLVALTPMGFSSMALVVHPRAGGPVSAAVFANALPGMIGFTAALVTVHLATIPLGTWAALGLALAVGIAWNLGLIWLRSARAPTAP